MAGQTYSVDTSSFMDWQARTYPTEVFVSLLKRVAGPIPTIADQHRIVAEVERRLSVIEELEATVAANLKRAERLRQSVLGSAFRG